MKILALDERGRQIQSKLRAGVRVPASGLLINSGRRRSQGKRALLAAIDQPIRSAGKEPVFKANF